MGSLNSDVFAPIEFCSKKIRRKGSSSFDVECINCVDTVDMCHVVSLLYEELLHGIRPSLTQKNCFRLFGMEYDAPSITVVIDVDAKDIISRVYSLKRSLDISKRRRLDISDLREVLLYGEVSDFRHIAGATNPTDIGTKKIKRHSTQFRRYLKMIYAGEYVPDLPSGGSSSQCLFSTLRFFG